MSDGEVAAAPNSGWRHRLGLLLFFGAFPVFLITLAVIPMLGFSAGESAALIGGVLLVVELLWFASIPLLGKSGFQQVKERAFGWLKPSTRPPTRARHRFGVALLAASVALDVSLNLIMVVSHILTDPNEVPTALVVGLTFEQQATAYVLVQMATALAIMVALLILGPDFWERLKRAFEWQDPDTDPGPQN